MQCFASIAAPIALYWITVLQLRSPHRILFATFPDCKDSCLYLLPTHVLGLCADREPFQLEFHCDGEINNNHDDKDEEEDEDEDDDEDDVVSATLPPPQLLPSSHLPPHTAGFLCSKSLPSSS